MRSKRQRVVGHCYGLNPRWSVKLPKSTIWWELKIHISWGKKKEKEHFIKFQTVQHKSCLWMLCNLYGKKKYSPALISLIVTPPNLQVLLLFYPLGGVRQSSLCSSSSLMPLYMKEGPRLDIVFLFLPTLFPHPKYPLQSLLYCFKQQGWTGEILNNDWGFFLFI